MRVAIIGSGLQTRRRAPVIVESPGDELVEIAGVDPIAPPGILEQLRCSWSNDWRRTVARSDIDAVLICTPPGTACTRNMRTLMLKRRAALTLPMRGAAGLWRWVPLR